MWGGITRAGLSQDEFLDVKFVVDAPNLPFTLVGHAGAVERALLSRHRDGRHASREVGEHVSVEVVGPEAIVVATLTAGKDDLLASVDQYAAIVIVIAVVDLSHDRALVGIGQIDAMMAAAVLGEA